jgi:Na+/pantothenate symporter
MLIFLGVINGAFIFPIVLGLFWKKMNKNAAFWAVILASSIGYYIYYTIGALQGVVASGWISFLYH